MELNEKGLPEMVERKIGMTVEKYVEVLEAAIKKIDTEDDNFRSPVDTSKLSDTEFNCLMKIIEGITKENYYTIVAKILIYLYAKIKGKNKRQPEEYLLANTKEFPIAEEYLKFVLSEMERHGYIQLKINRTWSGDVIKIDISNIKITQEGIDYLSENPKIRKAIEAIPAEAAVMEIFI